MKNSTFYFSELWKKLKHKKVFLMIPKDQNYITNKIRNLIIKVFLKESNSVKNYYDFTNNDNYALCILTDGTFASY